MTCIVALVRQGIVYFAGDSLTVSVPSQYHSNVGQTVRNETKIWKKGEMLQGGNGNVRMLQILRYLHEPPVYTPEQNKVRYLTTEFIPSLKKCFVENGYPEDDMAGNILLSLEAELFVVGSDFGICGTADGYDSVGKSSQVAIGSLHTTDQLQLPPKECLYLALLATERHTCVVSAPYWYISSQMEQEELLEFRTKSRE